MAINHGNPTRPGQWAKIPRVAFIAHALMPDYLSTALIDQRLRELGLDWPESGEDPGWINWFSFPVCPRPASGGQPVWVDFYIIPVLASRFFKAVVGGQAYKWAEEVALAAISEAQADGVELTVGWGALTKLATNHGQLFLEKHPELNGQQFNSTHGDAGTALLVTEGLVRAGVQPGCRVAVVGANGAIGDAASRAITAALQPENIVLVGKADRPGEKKNLSRLEELQQRVKNHVRNGSTEVAIHQDKTSACHSSEVVIVATTGMNLSPKEVPVGALVMDMTTPAACQPDRGWSGHLVLTAGCGEFSPEALPWGFGNIGGSQLQDVGAGGPRVIWGCTGETIARAVFGWRGHLAGTVIPIDALEWCNNHFKRLGFVSQPPLNFNNPITWSRVGEFVTASRQWRPMMRLIRRSPPAKEAPIDSGGVYSVLYPK